MLSFMAGVSSEAATEQLKGSVASNGVTVKDNWQVVEAPAASVTVKEVLVIWEVSPVREIVWGSVYEVKKVPESPSRL